MRLQGEEDSCGETADAEIFFRRVTDTMLNNLQMQRELRGRGQSVDMTTPAGFECDHVPIHHA